MGVQPQRLILELSNHCDRQCRYCSTASGPRGSLVPTVHYWSRLIRQFGSMQGEELVLSGGEPLLYPGLFALVREAARTRIPRVTVVTSGLHADPWAVRELAGSSNLTVLVSLDSLQPEAHDWLRGPESHARAIQGLVRLREGLPGYRLGLAVTVSRLNMAGLPDLVQWAEEEGLGRLLWAELAAIGRGSLLPDLVPTPDEVAALHRGLFSGCTHGGPTLVEYWGEADLEGAGPDLAVRVTAAGEAFSGRGPGATVSLGVVGGQGLGQVLL